MILKGRVVKKDKGEENSKMEEQYFCDIYLKKKKRWEEY